MTQIGVLYAIKCHIAGFQREPDKCAGGKPGTLATLKHQDARVFRIRDVELKSA